MSLGASRRLAATAGSVPSEGANGGRNTGPVVKPRDSSDLESVRSHCRAGHVSPLLCFCARGAAAVHYTPETSKARTDEKATFFS